MVLKIVRPDLKVTLLDSLNKRIIFLNDVLYSGKIIDLLNNQISFKYLLYILPNKFISTTEV